MKLKKKLFKYRTGLLMTAGCIIIMVITLFFVGEKNVPYVLGDEFGYWTSAAYFFGYDWSGIASINGYFSFGYGLLLTPLFLLKDSVLMYRTAIVMNALFLVGSFVLAYIAGQKLFPKIRLQPRFILPIWDMFRQICQKAYCCVLVGLLLIYCYPLKKETLLLR